MESNTTVQDNNPDKRAIIPDIMSQLDYGDNDPNLSSESVMYTPKDERTPSESLKKAKELEKSLPISKKEKAAVDALLDMYVLDETKEKEIAMNIDKKSRKIRKRYTSSPSNLVLKLSIEKDGKYKLKRGGKRRNRKTIPLTQYGGSPQNEFYNAVRRAAYDDGVGDMSSIDLLRVFLSRPDINARYLVDSDTSDDDSDTSDNYPNDENFTALFVCCLIKNPEVVRFLLENGAKLMGQELLALIMHNHFPNPIQEENINLEIATMLLDHEHTYDVHNDNYEVYRLDSVLLDDDDELPVALRARERALPREFDGTRLAYVNSIYSMNSATALHYAAAKSQPSLVRLLLERGANIDAVMMRGGFMGITPIMLAKDILEFERMSLEELGDGYLTRETEIKISKLEETISILNKHYAKRNAKQHLVDQMGPPNMKDLQTTAELPRGRRVTANTDDYSIQDGDGVIRKKIKSYLGGNRTRNLLKYKIKESVLS